MPVVRIRATLHRGVHPHALAASLTLEDLGANPMKTKLGILPLAFGVSRGWLGSQPGGQAPRTLCPGGHHGRSGTLLSFQPYGEEGLLIADIDIMTATGLLAARCRTVL